MGWVTGNERQGNANPISGDVSTGLMSPSHLKGQTLIRCQQFAYLGCC